MTKPLTQTIKVLPGWDKRDTNGGFHGCEVLFVLQGPAGVLTFAVATDWAPMTVQLAYMNGIKQTNVIGVQPRYVDFVYHSFKPSDLPGQTKHEDCLYSPDGVCYASSSKRTAEYLRDVLLVEGSEGIWRELGQRYRSNANVTQTAERRI